MLEHYLVVHRDVEPKHIGWSPGGICCLIDLGSAAPLPATSDDPLTASAPSSQRGYSGEAEMNGSGPCPFSLTSIPQAKLTIVIG